MIGFSVFLCKEKIAIIKRKREKGHVDLSSSTLEGKKKTENGTKRLIFTAVSILLEIVFLLFLFTKVSEYATIIDWATRIVAIFLVLGLYSMDKTSSMKMPWIILMLAFPILGVSLYLLVGLNGSTKKMRARYEEIDKKLLPYLPDNRQILVWMKEESPQAGAVGGADWRWSNPPGCTRPPSVSLREPAPASGSLLVPDSARLNRCAVGTATRRNTAMP